MSRTGKVFLYMVYFAAIIVLGSFILTSAKVGESPNNKPQPSKTEASTQRKKPTTVATTDKAGSTVPKTVSTPEPVKQSTTPSTPKSSATNSSPASSASTSPSQASSSNPTSPSPAPATSQATSSVPTSNQANTASTGELTNTGPGNIVGLFVVTTIVGTVGFRYWLLRRANIRF